VFSVQFSDFRVSGFFQIHGFKFFSDSGFQAFFRFRVSGFSGSGASVPFWRNLGLAAPPEILFFVVFWLR
jgi:hypothetical protein